MKIAIHHRPGSYSDQWIDYCEAHHVDYKLINAYDNDAIEQMRGCDLLMWHHHHNNYKDVMIARKVLYAAEHSGMKVYPDFRTAWHFDDKVAQKYLLEAVGAPLVPSYVFYDKNEALRWAKNTIYPKVFKLKGGAGAANVRLINDATEACRLIKKSFGGGHPQFDRVRHLSERWGKFRNKQASLKDVLSGMGRLLITPEFTRKQAPEKGYIYFQDFMPNNKSDIRVIIIGKNKAVAEERFVRENDFRASGSGIFSYENIPLEVIQIAFDVSNKLQLQSVAFDFVYDEEKRPKIIEISYGFGTKGILSAPGYWDDKLAWYEAEVEPQEWILKNLLST